MASPPSAPSAPSAVSKAASDDIVAATTASGSGEAAQRVKLRSARPSPRSISHVKQKPLFPGMFRHVSMFEGEHVYHYGRHTFTIMRDSVVMGIIPAGCILGYIVTHMPSGPVIPFEVQCLFMAALFVLSRLMAAGRRNRCTKDLTGRHVVLTGGTSGIGKATAAQLAKMGADITIIAKDSPHAAEALLYVRSHAKNSVDQQIHLQPLNLDDFIAVREYCKRARHSNRSIDILVNAAGVLQEKYVTTRFGDDMQLAINFLGPYLLTEGLLPLVEAAHGRIVYVACSAHVGVKGNVVQTYLSGRGVWSPRVADKFDGLEQYGFTKLGNIFHAQQLALRSYPKPAKSSVSSRLTLQQQVIGTPGGRKQPASRRSGYAAAVEVAAASQASGTEAAGATATVNIEPRFTCCACSPGGVITNLYRSTPFSGTFVYLYYLYILVMRTAWEGSQTVVNCCVRDDFKNGGYYMNTRYQPAGLSKTACNVAERDQVMTWVHNKMKPYMKWE
ncbi:short chain dehydrogenase/reductase, putative [Leishmania donovani]|uniref:Short chain dehydrogenase family protein n=1 Tax=Leishmania donovani TaxID=5661 RepID=E9BH50_LEIDO|nr:short chain dehydrogenase/reductase, putative [Leishmania donovani]TPP52312.1 short chain dehydrogenase family protein [Leishmania donovani]CBZ34576.1 short chain dehydrogenase/reductase, putative [Leishmania donovani]